MKTIFKNRMQKATIFAIDARKMSITQMALNVPFVANLRRLTFGLVAGASNSLNYKKAAMFAMDARIALVVFTSLSVVAFATISSMITKSEATRIISDMKTVEKAYQNFLTDTQYKLTKYSNPFFYNINKLVDVTKISSIPYTVKYKGPYLPYEVGTTSNFLIHTNLENNIALVSRSFNNFAASDKLSECSDTDCFMWVVFYDISTDVARKIDIIVDGFSDYTTGNIRLEANGNNFDVYYKSLAEK